MANWTADHKMTGVGNALKRHYRKRLWEYERANQPIQQQISIEQCMGQNPNTMPAEALPASIQQQQPPPMQQQHFLQHQQVYGAQHAQHSQMAAQQHMQGQPQQYQPPR
jgi:hypothetical protein